MTMLLSMPLSLLAWASLLGLVHAVSTGAVAMQQQGAQYAMSPRDEQRPLSPRRARNLRAFANFMQTFPMFAAAVLVSHAAGRDHGVASWGAQLYFWARVAYVPAYVTGSRLRSGCFFAALAGIVLVLLSVA